MRTRAPLVAAALLLAGCDRAPPVAPQDLEASDAAARTAAIANEQAWIDRMRADVQRNAALAAALDDVAEDPFANLLTPEPVVPENAAAPAETAPPPAAPPSDEELRAAEAAVGAAMAARRADRD